MASLNPLSSNLDLRLAKHLLRRATFKYSKEILETFVGMSPEDAVARLFAPSGNILAEPYDPLPTENPEGFWTSIPGNPNQFCCGLRKRAIVTGWWWYNATQHTTLKYKLAFFLHTSFPVAKDTEAGEPTHFFDHLNLLDFYAYGNLKAMARKIILDNVMLDYLDNSQNNKNNPNENFAREYLELHTIMKGPQIGPGNYTNYTEIDIQQAAKVFTGFKVLVDNTNNIDPDTQIPMGQLVLKHHDTEDKTFSSAFGGKVITGRDTEQGAFEELDDFVEMVFEQRETAKAYCRKLYRYFVKSTWTEEVENDIIEPLAQILIDNNYEIIPVVTKLLTSEHFYDADDGNPEDNIIGSIIKSPLQFICEINSMFELEYPDPVSNPSQYYLNFFRAFLHNQFFANTGMEFFNPDSVAGYPAYYQEPDFDNIWFSSNTIIARYTVIEGLIKGRNTYIGNNRIYTILDTVAFVKNKIENASDANLLISEIASLLYPERIDTDRITYFKSFLIDDGFEDYYWTDAWVEYLSNNDDSVVKIRLDALIIAMVNAAEFQLM